jgi:survival of motor neuron-related-splicing factor 30
MADDLSNYKLQLQQVEVALLSDPENAELLKLKEDIGKTDHDKQTVFIYFFYP